MHREIIAVEINGDGCKDCIFNGSKCTLSEYPDCSYEDEDGHLHQFNWRFNNASGGLIDTM